MAKITTKLILEFDDFHPSEPENCLESVYTLVFLYPEIKINLFTIPNLRKLPLSKDKKWCNDVRRLILDGNLVLGVHGYSHELLEFESPGYQTALDKLQKGSRILLDAELPYARVFRGPHWGLNVEAIYALRDSNFTHIYNHEDHRHLGLEIINCGMKAIYYNWNLKDEFDEELLAANFIIAHGHTHHTCGNGIQEVFLRLTEFIDKYKPTFHAIDSI